MFNVRLLVIKSYSQLASVKILTMSIADGGGKLGDAGNSEYLALALPERSQLHGLLEAITPVAYA